MKKYLLFTILVLSGRAVSAFGSVFLIDPVKEPVGEYAGGNDATQFVFKIYDIANEPKGEIESHFLGDEIASKWTLVNELYLKKGEISVGFGSSYTETIKPSVFNAVCKMNSYYKKALGKGIVSKEDALSEFSWILDCALAAFLCDETAEFESALMKVREPGQIIRLFKAVKIEKI